MNQQVEKCSSGKSPGTDTMLFLPQDATTGATRVSRPGTRRRRGSQARWTL